MHKMEVPYRRVPSELEQPLQQIHTLISLALGPHLWDTFRDVMTFLE